MKTKASVILTTMKQEKGFSCHQPTDFDKFVQTADEEDSPIHSCYLQLYHRSLDQFP
jgi:hypothetical protein